MRKISPLSQETLWVSAFAAAFVQGHYLYRGVLESSSVRKKRNKQREIRRWAEAAADAAVLAVTEDKP